MSHSPLPLFDHFFLPSDGTIHPDLDDLETFSASTPIPIEDFPTCFLPKTSVKGFDPPTFWCGWRVGRKGLVELVQKHYEEEIIATQFNDENNGFYRDVVMFKLPELVERELGVLVELNTVGDENGDEGDPASMALTLTNNRNDFPDRHVIDLVKNKLFEGEEPQWYVDLDKFYWSRLEGMGSPQGNLDDLKEEHQKVRSERIMAAQVVSAKAVVRFMRFSQRYTLEMS